MHGIFKSISPAVGSPDNRSPFLQVAVADIIVRREKYFIVCQKYLQYKMCIRDSFGKAQKAVVLLGYQINHIAVPFDMAVADFTLGLDQVLNGLFLGCLLYTSRCV